MISLEQQIFNQIDRAKNILITFPVDWNGDAVASALAFYLFLKKLNKNVEVVAGQMTDRQNEVFNFLPKFDEIKSSLDNLTKFVVSVDITNAKVDQIKYVINDNTLNFIISPKSGWFSKEDVKAANSGYKYDLIIVINAPDLESLGQIYDNNVDFFYKTTIINVDHSPANEEYGQVNFVELNAVSASEVLFEILRDYRPDLIDEAIATCLLTGIICKTRSFKTPNLTPHALATTSELIRLGAKREEIVNRLYRSRDLNVLKLWGRVLNNLQSSPDGQVVWSTLYENDFSATKAATDNLPEVIDELIINMPLAKVIVILYSLSEINLATDLDDKSSESTVIRHAEGAPANLFQSAALVYAVKNINALDLVKELQPSGTRKLAYIKNSKPLQSLSAEIIKSIQDKLDKMPS